MVVPSRWWLQNLILRQNYEKDFKVYKKCKYEHPKIFVVNSIWGIKTEIFDADLEKSLNSSCKKFINEKVMWKWSKSNAKIEFLTFITVCKRILPIHFVGWSFLIFLNLKSAINLTLKETAYNFSLTFKPNAHKKHKKTKSIVYNCVWELNSTNISGLGSSILSKKVKMFAQPWIW